jgi:hypothetical protein
VENTHRKCRDCGLKQASYSLPPSRARLWCAGCAKKRQPDARLQGQVGPAAGGRIGDGGDAMNALTPRGAGVCGQRLCEDCSVTVAGFVLPPDLRRRWCARCADGHPGSRRHPSLDKARRDVAVSEERQQ